MAIKKNKLFSGFNTKNRKVGSFLLHDVDLIKRDLLNHFNTRKGERVMLPEYGSIIWDLMFEPLTDGVREDIIDDAIRIVNLDTRAELQDINVVDLDNGFRIEISLLFTPFNVLDTFSVDFDKRSQNR